MRTKQLLTIAMVSMLLIGGMAALGAASPNDAANENATDGDDENVPDDAGDAADEREERAENVSDEEAANGTDEAAQASEDDNASAEDAPGPDVDLPEQAPDHVSHVHETINQFLDEEIDDLGEALSELLGGDANDEVAESAANESADNASAPEDPANASEEHSANAASIGPSDGMPDQAADKVSDIHETIESFLNDEIENLGEALSELLGDDADASDA